MLRVEPSGFPALERDWNRLLDGSASDTIFLTWEWQSLWWEKFHQNRGSLLLTVRDDDRLIGLLPLYFSGNETVGFMGGTEIADYLDVIALKGRESEILEAALRYLLGISHWATLDLYNVKAVSPTREVLGCVGSKLGLHCDDLLEDVCPVIALPDDWEGYLASLDKKRRHELRRKIRKAEREARIEWQVVRGGEDLRGEMTAFLELHRRSSPDKRRFMDRSMEGFFLAMGEVMAKRDWLRLYFISVNGERAASLLCFSYKDGLLVYNSGYEPERYSSLAPGMLLTAYAIEEAIKDGKKVFDLLQGGEEYKYRFGARDTEVRHLVMKRPGL